MSGSNEEVSAQDERIPNDVQVLNAVSQTGFLLERQVHTALGRHGIKSSIGVAYSDPETHGHREIDVVGSMIELVQKRVLVNLDVLIECKKWSSGPLVGVGGVPTSRERTRVPTEFSIENDPVARAMKRKRRLGNFYRYYKLGEATHPLLNAEMLATQLVLMERKKDWLAQNTSVYDSIVLPLVKAQRSYADAMSELFTSDGDDDEDDVDDFYVSFTRSALVTTAPLRGVLWLNENDTRVIHPKYFPVIRNFSGKSMPDRFTFEIVSADHLDSWLSTQVVPFFRAMCQAVEEWLEDPLAGADG